MKWRLLALILGLVGTLVLVLLLAKVNPIQAASSLIHGSFGSMAPFGGTLRETTPLLLAGLAVFLALRVGLFNIGVEGQFLVGAMLCAAVCLRVPGPLGIGLGVVAACAGGAAWAWPAGWIRAYRNGHEVITTIMLNAVAIRLTDYLVAGPLKDPRQGEPTTAALDPGSRLPNLFTVGDFSLNWGFILGIVGAGALAWWLARTVLGFEWRAVGANPIAARFAGIRTKRVAVSAMALSGAIGGLAGAVQVVAYEGRFYSGFSPGYGFDALGVALLAGPSAWALLPSSLLFGALAKGGVALQIDGVPKGITTVVLGFAILIAAAYRYRGVPQDE